MKCASLLLVVAFIAVASAAGCYNHVCSDVGGQCGTPTADTMYTCKGGLYCDSTSKCAPVIQANGNCTGALFGCVDGYECRDQTCQMEQWGPGYLCNADSQCYTYNLTLNRVSTSCVSGRCAGLNNGDACNVTVVNQCGNGLYCAAISGAPTMGTCTPNPGVNAACNVSNFGICTDIRAGTRLLCSTLFSGVGGPQTGTCVAYFSQGLGANCTGVNHCQEGLICQAYGSGGFGTCAKPETTGSSMKTCGLTSSFTDCGALEACGCQSPVSSSSATVCMKINPNPSGYQKAWTDAISCESTNYDCFHGTSKCSGSCYKSICSTLAKGNSLKAQDTCSFTSTELDAFNKCLKAGAATYFLAPVVVVVALIAFLF